MFGDRRWSIDNNLKTPVWEYLQSYPEFEIDKRIQRKRLITVAADVYLRGVR